MTLKTKKIIKTIGFYFSLILGFLIINAGGITFVVTKFWIDVVVENVKIGSTTIDKLIVPYLDSLKMNDHFWAFVLVYFFMIIGFIISLFYIKLVFNVAQKRKDFKLRKNEYELNKIEKLEKFSKLASEGKLTQKQIKKFEELKNE